MNHFTYDVFVDTIAVLSLPFSPSQLHGTLCGYLCAGAYSQGEHYLRALLGNHKDEAHRRAAMVLFAAYTFSQQQITECDFEFELLLPDDEEDLHVRARAFSEWCEGFVQGLTLSGITTEQFADEEAQDAVQHLTQFAELDVEALTISEEDERALMEINEYARMAVLRLHKDLEHQEKHAEQQDKIKH